jgi:DinB superfamily
MMKRSLFTLVAVALFAVGGMNPCLQAQTDQTPGPAASRAEEMVKLWNSIGNKLVAMAQDFPEDKYDFKVQKDQRTFADNLLHAAGFEYVVARRISGDQSLGPNFGEGDNPPRAMFKTKADVVKFVQGAVAAGADVIGQQGDAGLDKTTPWGKRLAHNSYIWGSAIEHSGEHYGQLVVYYRANNMVPPDSRR